MTPNKYIVNGQQYDRWEDLPPTARDLMRRADKEMEKLHKPFAVAAKVAEEQAQASRNTTEWPFLVCLIAAVATAVLSLMGFSLVG